MLPLPSPQEITAASRWNCRLNFALFGILIDNILKTLQQQFSFHHAAHNTYTRTVAGPLLACFSRCAQNQFPQIMHKKVEQVVVKHL